MWMPIPLCELGFANLVGIPALPFGSILLPGALWAQLWEEAGCGYVHMGVTWPFQPLCRENGLPDSQVLGC